MGTCLVFFVVCLESKSNFAVKVWYEVTLTFRSFQQTATPHLHSDCIQSLTMEQLQQFARNDLELHSAMLRCLSWSVDSHSRDTCPVRSARS